MYYEGSSGKGSSGWLDIAVLRRLQLGEALGHGAERRQARRSLCGTTELLRRRGVSPNRTSAGGKLALFNRQQLGTALFDRPKLKEESSAASAMKMMRLGVNVVNGTNLVPTSVQTFYEWRRTNSAPPVGF
jgi:hypothetical protein